MLRLKKTEDEINLVETNWIQNQLSDDRNYNLLEDEKPSKRFLNMESGKGGVLQHHTTKNQKPSLRP